MKWKKYWKEEKMKFENDLAKKAKNDPKKVYAYIKSKIGVKEQIRALKTKEGDETVDRKKNC